jgi:hypothetical protein
MACLSELQGLGGGLLARQIDGSAKFLKFLIDERLDPLEP